MPRFFFAVWPSEQYACLADLTCSPRRHRSRSHDHVPRRTAKRWVYRELKLERSESSVKIFQVIEWEWIFWRDGYLRLQGFGV